MTADACIYVKGDADNVPFDVLHRHSAKLVCPGDTGYPIASTTSNIEATRVLVANGTLPVLHIAGALPKPDQPLQHKTTVNPNRFEVGKPEDTIHALSYDSHGRHMIGLAGMTPDVAVHLDGKWQDRNGDGSTICDGIHDRELYRGKEHKGLSNNACHFAAGDSAGEIARDYTYDKLKAMGVKDSVAKSLSYLSGAIAGTATTAARDDITDKTFERSDVSPGRVPLYVSDNGGVGVFVLSNLYRNVSVQAVARF